MLLADAGPLVALIDRGERRHQACVDILKRLTRPMVTTWSAFTEAMYVLGRTGSSSAWHFQDALWRIQGSGLLVLHELSREESARARELMARYADRPMDLADATLVASAERLNCWTIFTLDAHFHAYRGERGESFSVVPG